MLPKRVIGILQRQRRKDRRVAVMARRIRDSEVARQRAERSTVASNMMNEQQEHLLVWRENEELDADRRFDGEIESVVSGRGECLGKFRLGRR